MFAGLRTEALEPAFSVLMRCPENVNFHVAEGPYNVSFHTIFFT